MFRETVENIPSLDQAAMQAAEARQRQLTKPQGSLGRLEELSIQLAGIYAQPIPSIREKAVIVMAGDHGVAAEGVSAFPQEVTPQMVLNFLRGGAALAFPLFEASLAILREMATFGEAGVSEKL